MITICLTYFRSLTLANLAAALYSVRWQDLSYVAEVVIIDNNTDDSVADIYRLLDIFQFPVRVRLISHKHGDPLKTHSWSMNTALSEVMTPLVLCTRADYIIDASLTRKSYACDADFVVAKGYHLSDDVGICEGKTRWRQEGAGRLLDLPGTVIDYTLIDSGVFFARTEKVLSVGGFDEGLTAWGHAQTEFQHRLALAGARFHCIPEVLFYHPLHAGERDIDLAHAQLRAKGIEIKDLWKRHDGEQPYR